MRRFLLTSAMALSIGATPALAAQTFGLVIGVDEYDHIPDLQGAVNDAQDIAAALEGIDADVTLLLNGEASRAAIIGAWQDIAAKVQPGDRVVISYAGHGSNEPEHFAGSEADGRDENLLLAGFSPYGADSGERIRDDEIAELLALTPDAQVIFVADACHSGTLSRDINPVLGYRYVANGQLQDDPLPPPPPPVSQSEGREDVSLFLAAVDEADKVPEFLIDGKPRGALSYSFAAGLRGAADLDGDAALTRGEIATYVRRNVREVSQGVQSPQVSPAGDGSEVLFQLRSVPAPQTAQDIFALSFDALPFVQIAYSGDAATERMFGRLIGVELRPAATSADLLVDMNAGVIRSMVGDTVREIPRGTPEAVLTAVQAVVDKTRFTNALRASRSAMDVRFADGDRTYHAGEIVTVGITGRQTPELTLMNVASDGAMAFLYPLQGDGLNDPHTLDPSDTLDLSLRVAPPFGADHIIAFETSGNAESLRRALARAEEAGNTRALWDLLRAAAADMGHAPEITVFPFYTAAAR